ncbi:MAG: YtfJ family protein [Bacteroidota bacterium]|nr:YtfJ family protein [Bacteroidota bacterium]
MKTKIAGVILIVLLISGSLFSALPIGKIASLITLSGDDGGKVDGTAWSSSELVGKVWMLVYADPDESDLNNAATEAVKAKHYSQDVYGSVAVINMAATWKPNFAISLILKGKQKDYPNTVYVKDKKSILVKKWGLADDSNSICVFDYNGKVIFSKDGQLSEKDIAEMISLMDAEIAKNE